MLDRTVFSERTLTNLAGALDNFRLVSDKAAAMAEHVGRLIDTNSPGVSISISNMVAFSRDLDSLTTEMGQTLLTNRIELTKAVKSLQFTATALQGMVNDVEAGKGLIGFAFKDEHLKTDLSAIAANVVVLTSNLNRYGLLYKPKPPKNNAVAPPTYRGKSPFDK